MAFQIGQLQANFTNLSVGNLQIGVINYDASQLANFLMGFVRLGSQRHKVYKDDLNIRKDPNIATPNPVTLEWLIGQGNPLFNSLFFLGLPVNERPSVRSVAPGPDGVPAIPITDICEALFVQYFFILVRGSPSEEVGTQLNTVIPNFLANVLSLGLAPNIYARRLSTFPLNKVDPGWVRYIPIQQLGREAANRLGLGVAGYRVLAPFKYLPMPGNMPSNLQAAYTVAMSFIQSPYNWDIHSATRDPNILATYGPLNANLGNLALDIFEKKDLDELVASRQLFKLPQKDPKANNYKAWSVPYTPNRAHDVFPTIP